MPNDTQTGTTGTHTDGAQTCEGNNSIGYPTYHQQMFMESAPRASNQSSTQSNGPGSGWLWRAGTKFNDKCPDEEKVEACGHWLCCRSTD
ncbi:uncharacterized protein L201_006654 [Kwoniella dendrophila CBS 6074]|uniref:Uncharacterized protein n=1 Tax=Kwoniella dendrophila CBS 6074 TaxID=1295534 RepID=A0AAX4K4P7_9TREE